MDIIQCENELDVAKFANQWCSDSIKEVDAQSLYLPAGGTPIPLYKMWEEAHPDFLNQLKLIQIDEVVTGSKTGVFKSFFEEHLPSYLKQMVWIGDESIQADLAILGLGPNGHVAFHEPHLSRKFKWGEVDLSDNTCERLGLEVGCRGKTYGLQSFLATKKVLLMVCGESKQEVLHSLLSFNTTLPATVLMGHADFTIVADRMAYPGK